MKWGKKNWLKKWLSKETAKIINIKYVQFWTK